MIQDLIPANWETGTLGTLVVVERGSSPRPIKNFITNVGGVNWIKIGDMKEGQKFVVRTAERITEEGASKSRFVGVGDFILSNSMSFGRPYIMAIEGYIHDGWFALRLPSLINSEYFYYLLSSSLVQDQFQLLAVGGVVKNISGDLVKQAVLPLPPLAEQKVIAEKLDTLLAQVDNTKARLERIPDILKRFRQSVLAAAVSGKLTEEWRGTDTLTGWNTVKLDQIVENIEAGKNLQCIEVPPKSDEFGIVKISAVTWGFYDEEQSKTLPDKRQFLESRRICVGDFLISRANTIELLGNPVIVHKVTKNLMLSDKVLRLVMPEKDKPWVRIFLRSKRGRMEIESRSTGNQMSMRNIGQKALLDIDLPKPPIEEQTEIVRRVEELFAFADRIEHAAQAALSRVNNLTQSILAKAFRGELTADWRAANPELISGENSAAALLARIKAERDKVKPTKKAKAG